MMDLIDRKAAIEAMYDFMVCGSFAFLQCGGDLEEKIKSVPSIPAVPLDKLCHWLAEHYGSPCQLAEIDCYPQCEPDENGECYGMRTDDKRCWHDYLTKWMEGLDAAD